MTNTQIGFVLCERMLSSGLSLPIEMWKAAASSYLAEQKNIPRRHAQTGEVTLQALSPGEYSEGEYHWHKQRAHSDAQWF